MASTRKQIDILMKYLKTSTQEAAAAKANVSLRTARRYQRRGSVTASRAPRGYRTRTDPFDEVWDEVRTMLGRDCGLEAKTIFEWLQVQHIGKFNKGQLRTLQRRIREWRATEGPEKDVKFPQNIQPGRQSQSDYTWCNELNISIRGKFFEHMLFHFMLPYSRWEAISLAFTESFETLTDGYRRAVRRLGAVAREHRTDNLAAAVPIGKRDEFQKRWRDFLSHYGVEPSANNPRQSHENGSVEKSHDELKTAIDQRLRLRGSRDFDSVDSYMRFVQLIVDSRNKQRKEKLMEEMKRLEELPDCDWSDPKEIFPTVSAWSTIVVFKAIYSVPSRLIGTQVRVMAYPESIQVYLGRKLLLEMPRVQAGAKSINYRHVISHLLRKPGAFRNYQFREELFPSTTFRRAFDRLCIAGIDRGEKQYLGLLNVAALNGEQEVAAAIDTLLEMDAEPTQEAVKALVEKKKETPKVIVEPPNLAAYDSLLTMTMFLKEETPTQNRQQELESLLCAFRLPAFQLHYAGFARQAEKERIDHVGYLYQLAKTESEQRYQRRTERLLRESKLPKGKRLDDFELARFPHICVGCVWVVVDGACLDRQENVLIFGNPGTGKTHLSISLAREWCLRGRRVFYSTAAMLVQDLLAAKRDLRLNQVLRRLDKVEVLLIDDISYIPKDRDEGDVLFMLLAECYERRSVAITSNLAFSDWNQIFKDPMTTMAAIDRLVHHSVILELNGPSWRAEEAKKKQQRQKAKDHETASNSGNDN